MPPALQPDAPWYEAAFDRTWLAVNARRDDEAADREAKAVVELLGLRAGVRLLDVCCGAGRHARAFARRGLLVTGVDLSADLLQAAREASPLLPGKPDYLRWDVRRMPFGRQFQAAVSMFTSFGYFKRREDDEAIFRGVARALVPAGRFLLDYLNEAHVRRSLVPHDERDVGRFHVVSSRRIGDSTAGPAVFKRVEVRERSSGRVRADYEERVRLYTLEEIDALLGAAGFVIEGEPLGDVFGAPHGPDAERLVRIARAP